MTDDFQSAEGKGNVALVNAATRLARQISKTLGAGNARGVFDEAERAAILREAFGGAVDAAQPDVREVRATER
jgi:hypothetical protein